MRIAVLEAEIAGLRRVRAQRRLVLGAVRRRAATLPRRPTAADAAVALQRALFATVDEVGAVAAAEGIDADFHKGGTLELATAAMQVPRLHARVEGERSWGFGPEDVRVARRRRGRSPAGRRRAFTARSSHPTARGCTRRVWLAASPTRPSVGA